MSPISTGRPLDEDGEPADGPALELDPDGEAAALLRESPGALASSPGSGLWSTIRNYPTADRDGAPEMVVWLDPDGLAPPEHVHTDETETFEAVTGTLTLVVDGELHRLAPGESLTIRPGQAHTFRNDTDETVAFRAETPWTKTIDTQFTFCGLDHEGVFGADGGYGEPDFLQGILVGEAIRAKTTITEAPRPVQRLLWATVGRVGKLAGRRAVDERYLRDEFWEATVEQPDI